MGGERGRRRKSLNGREHMAPSLPPRGGKQRCRGFVKPRKEPCVAITDLRRVEYQVQERLSFRMMLRDLLQGEVGSSSAPSATWYSGKPLTRRRPLASCEHLKSTTSRILPRRPRNRTL